jgi:exo-beta-1,3-glucanase (GH17 family)
LPLSTRGSQGSERVYPSRKEIDSDLALLAGRTHAVRTYSVHDILGEIPAMARKHDLNVALGAWLDDNLEWNEEEVTRLLKVVPGQRNVVRIIVGNEVLLRGNLTVPELIAHLDKVRSAVQIPVSTAEPWHVWTKHPELVDHVDYIAVHMLPFGKGCPWSWRWIMWSSG